MEESGRARVVIALVGRVEDSGRVRAVPLMAIVPRGRAKKGVGLGRGALLVNGVVRGVVPYLTACAS
tara:strand:+ start:151 stop:351 length:201 start_codon:yes stop_codon:yes gene_type:complete